MSAILEALLGPLGALLAGLAAIAGAWLLGKRKGGSQARTERASQDAAAYREERKRQDEMEVGIGASDSERIDRLRDIAHRGGASDD